MAIFRIGVCREAGSMLRKEEIRYVRETIAPHVAPILSLYVDVNPARPENGNKAWLVRVKNTVRALSVPRDVADRVISHLEVERPAARTYAMFAAHDLLQLSDVRNGRVQARWGEPYVFPLLYVLDEYERFGVVFIDQERWRFFEVFLGEIQEIGDAFAPLAKESGRLIIDRPAQRYVKGALLRGGAAGDRFVRHLEASVQRFYKQMAHLLQQSVESWHIDRLILMGPHEDTSLFEQYLPRSLRSRVACRLPSLPRPGASASEVAKKVEPVIEEVRKQQELDLLKQVREKGIWGLSPVLEALQLGRLYVLVAPWNPTARVWRCENGLVVKDETEARTLCPDEQAHQVELSDVLVDLAASYATRLEFVKDEVEEVLHRDFGGLAGIPRW